MTFSNSQLKENFNKLITHCCYGFFKAIPVSSIISKLQVGILNAAGKPNGSTTYARDDGFYCLVAEPSIDFGRYSRWVRIELAPALHSDFFLKNVTFAIFGRVRSLTRPDLYIKFILYPKKKKKGLNLNPHPLDC